MEDETRQETKIAEMDPEAIHSEHHPGQPSAFGCPECGGVLWEIKEGDLPRFRCRVGHAWSSDSLLERQTSDLETALWSALRTLEENAALSERLRERARKRGSERSACRFQDQVDDAKSKAEIIRRVLTENTVTTRARIMFSDPHVSVEDLPGMETDGAPSQE
jgi:two-component system chemotaxis response regulator CheB